MLVATLTSLFSAVVAAATRLTEAEVTLVSVFLASLPPTLLALKAWQRSSDVKKEIAVPPRKARVLASDNEDSVSIGEALHEIRRDVYELGQLFGSHLLHHSENPAATEFPIAIEDLHPRQDKPPYPR